MRKNGRRAFLTGGTSFAACAVLAAARLGAQPAPSSAGPADAGLGKRKVLAK